MLVAYAQFLLFCIQFIARPHGRACARLVCPVRESAREREPPSATRPKIATFLVYFCEGNEPRLALFFGIAMIVVALCIISYAYMRQAVWLQLWCRSSRPAARAVFALGGIKFWTAPPRTHEQVNGRAAGTAERDMAEQKTQKHLPKIHSKDQSFLLA